MKSAEQKKEKKTGKRSVKKINAGFGLAAVVLLLVHVAYSISAYLLFLYNPLITKVLGYSFAVIVVAHILLSVINVYGKHDTASVRYYPKANIGTILQRTSGLLILLILPIHIKTGSWIMGHQVGRAGLSALLVAEVVFWAMVMTHVAISLPRALITLGWLATEKGKKRLDIVMQILCAALFVVAAYVVIRTQLIVYYR